METALTKTPEKRQVIFLAILLLLWEASSEAISYSMPEETESGYLVANLAQDLGIRVGELGRALVSCKLLLARRLLCSSRTQVLLQVLTPLSPQ